MNKKTKLLDRKATYLVFIFLASFAINLLGGNFWIPSVILPIITSILFAYPIYYVYQALRYRRWSIGNKHAFEIKVLQVASVIIAWICLSSLRVTLG